MSIKETKLTRRDFLKNVSHAMFASQVHFDPDLIVDKTKHSLIVRVHDSNASSPWNYEDSHPWDHTVEPITLEDMIHKKFRKDRYFDHINENIICLMFKRGMNELAGTRSTGDAWRKILKNYKKEDKFTIKINLNNASYNKKITTNRMDQTVPLINAIISDLKENLFVPEENVTVADPSRWVHPEILINRCRFKNINWVDSRSPDLWDPTESVQFSKDKPIRPDNPNLPEKVFFYLAKAYTKADHIINISLLKNHGCGITGAMKNHFGAIPPSSPKFLHTGLGEKSYIADLCNTNSIKNKVRLNVCDAIFANWHNNVWSPRSWKTFPEESPNSLFFGTDPVALDSVLLQHIMDEIEVQRDKAPRWVREAVQKHQFLHYAMEYHSLGIHEHKPFIKIVYRKIEN